MIMKMRFLSGLILLTASAFAQQLDPSLPLPPGLSRGQGPEGATRQRALRTIKAAKSPKLLYAEYYNIVPQVVDGLQAGQGVWTTELHVVNLDPGFSTTFELDFFNPDGSAASVGIVGTGGTVTQMSSVSGTLDPLQEVTYVTGGLPTTTQVGWAMLNQSVGGLFTTGYYVSVYETINLFNAAANYLASESGPSDFGIYNDTGNPGTSLAFDNTNSSFTTLAFVNPDAQIDAQIGTGYTAEVPLLYITFVNSAGAVIGSPVTYTVPTGTQTNVIMANTWPQTAGLAGTMYIIPYSTGCTSACPTLSDITVLALQSKSTQNGAGFSHTNAFVPLLTIGDYTN
jgi:hypothetical protein